MGGEAKLHRNRRLNSRVVPGSWRTFFMQTERKSVTMSCVLEREEVSESNEQVVYVPNAESAQLILAPQIRDALRFRKLLWQSQTHAGAGARTV
ncbi:hypothetical protein LSTR_LSTR017127 [Laodelphax striatellus]|uniref:Uncharacterized protein n=1 Tax=Laodelphax striatellus TaxID=195883 RepID=A0A482XIT4_LAOST|nr:hypothetical protein LSTR_LSTR017127 [Laodelphax striatellus]